jgi:hypothetical protein
VKRHRSKKTNVRQSLVFFFTLFFFLIALFSKALFFERASSLLRAKAAALKEASPQQPR